MAYDKVFPESAEGLIGYIEIHKETERALIRADHLLMLMYLAGVDVSLQNPKMLSIFVSLHSYDINQVLVDARKRVNDGQIFDDWKEKFKQFFQDKKIE